MSIKSNASDEIAALIGDFAESPGRSPIVDLAPQIAKFFTDCESLDGMMKALSNDDSDFAAETLQILSRMSPTSLRLTFEQLRRGRELSFDENLKMEFRIVRRIMEGHDFFEGVRAQIIDKDRSPEMVAGEPRRRQRWRCRRLFRASWR